MTEQMTEEQQACMQQAMQPGEQHKALEPFVGTFNAKVKMWMDPSGEPSESEGVMTSQWALGGRFVEQSYEGEAFGSVFQGKGFMGYDNTTQKYTGFWIDTASTMMQTETGDFDAAANCFNMSGTMTCPSSKEDFTKRDVIKVIDNDHHTMVMYFTGPDGKEVKGMEIQYTRIK